MFKFLKSDHICVPVHTKCFFEIPAQKNPGGKTLFLLFQLLQIWVKFKTHKTICFNIIRKKHLRKTIEIFW